MIMADDYVPTDRLVLESANSDLELVDSSTNSNADPPKIGMWVQALTMVPFAL